MVTVVVAILSTLGAVLAGLLPVLFVSERRRLLKLIKEESAALGEVTDPRAHDLLLKSLRASTTRYHQLASQTKAEKTRRQLFVGIWPVYVTFISGALLAGTNGLFRDEIASDAVIEISVGLALMLVGAVALTVLTVRAFLATRDETRHRAKLREARKNNDELADVVRRVQTPGGAATKAKVTLVKSNKSGTWRVQSRDEYIPNQKKAREKDPDTEEGPGPGD